MIRKALLSTTLATFIGVSSGSFVLAQATGPGAGKGQGGAGAGGMAMSDKCDTNADGRLTKEEFKSCYSARAEKKFTRIDADNDGSISREEAQQWAQRKASRGEAGGAAVREPARVEARAAARLSDRPTQISAPAGSHALGYSLSYV